MGTKVKISAFKRAQHLKKKKISNQKLNNKQSSAFNNLNAVPVKLSKKKERVKKPKKPQEYSDEDDETLFESIKDFEIDMEDLGDFNVEERKVRKRRKIDDNLEEVKSKKLEQEYTVLSHEEKRKEGVTIDLLPIKSKDGNIITRTAKLDKKEQKFKAILEEDNKESEANESEIELADSDDDIIRDSANVNGTDNETRAISNADLFIYREQELERQKYRIGIICSGILEKPEDKMKNFSVLFQLMEPFNEDGAVNLLSVRKLAIISISEIFKDILPEYRVGQVDPKMTTMRKTTLERVTYETALLQQLKKYLQKLEKITGTVTKRGGKSTPENVALADVSVMCMCDVLTAHPYFNYGQNIAQLLVYMLNCRYASIREKVNKCFYNLFSSDLKIDMTLFIIRRMNHLIKTKENNVHVEMLTCLLGLRIKNINLDAEKEKELKQKKLEAHKQRVINLSKRERKRRKRLAELNRELDETKAEENKQTKHYKLTEVVKMVFTIYFRILKKNPNSKLLSVCLEGLAKYAHVINMEFFSDLIEILNNLLEEENLKYREELHCIQTTFSILSGQGEALNIDPIRFYTHLYRNLLLVSAGKNHNDISIILNILDNVLIKRRKNISQQRMLAFAKRMATLSLHLLHNGALGILAIIKVLMQLSSTSLDILLDTDESIGSGRFNPELDDPEYCNANSTAFYELPLLMRHYHPTVKKLARHIASGVPSSGDGSLPPEIGKLTSQEIYEQFDSSEMAFNPPIPPPRETEPKIKKGRHTYCDRDLQLYCKSKLIAYRSNENFDFYTAYVGKLKNEMKIK